MDLSVGAPRLSWNKFLLFVMFSLEMNFLNLSPVNGEFENSWTMYMEQPCCSGTGNHHVRHHRGS